MRGECVELFAGIGPAFARGLVQARNLLFDTGAELGLQAVIGHRLFGQAQQIGAVMPALRSVFFHATGSCRFVGTGGVRR
jgi:hypothetical protein